MIYTGDCVAVMAAMEPESVDAIVTDPPYDLTSGKKGGTGVASVNLDSPYGRSRIGTGNGSGGFMGKAWDATGVAFDPATWREALRIAKPGAHLLAFGGTRTYHRLAAAIEDAGWEIRDCLVWAYASGFPKSLDVSKAIDKAAGAERPRTGVVRPVPDATASSPMFAGMTAPDGRRPPLRAYHESSAAWDGWGTALKPAWEPIVMARKPLRGTVAANVLAHGTGALNIDATRIGSGGDKGEWPVTDRAVVHEVYGARIEPALTDNGKGRWPANLLLTDPIFDGGVEGVVGGGAQETHPGKVRGGAVGLYGSEMERTGWVGAPAESGTYSRFFLVSKSSRSDREPVIPPEWYEDGKRSNSHPTCKPTELMRHLVRLVTPPGGTVLDCFLGSGTTAIAAELEGFAWIGIEREAEYVAIAEARLNGTQKGMGI